MKFVLVKTNRVGLKFVKVYLKKDNTETTNKMDKNILFFTHRRDAIRYNDMKKLSYGSDIIYQ